MTEEQLRKFESDRYPDVHVGGTVRLLVSEIRRLHAALKVRARKIQCDCGAYEYEQHVTSCPHRQTEKDAGCTWGCSCYEPPCVCESIQKQAGSGNS